MKSFACFVLFAAVTMQTAYSFVISSPCSPFLNGPIVASPSVFNAPAVINSPFVGPVVRAPGPVIAQSVVQPNTVANSLADTLSLLTVSSLLAETLPAPLSVLPMSTLPLGCGCSGFPSTILI